jgi:hypothetical protein
MFVLVACRAPRVPPARPASAIVVAPQGCLDRAQVEDRIRAVLIQHGAMATGLRVEASDVPEETGAAVSLRVLRPGGELGLDRAYRLARVDCASAPSLLALAVDRLLAEFPEWIDPAPPAPPPPERTLAIALAGAINGIWPPLGADGQLGAIADTELGPGRVGGSLRIRGSIPQRAGSGRFQQTSVLGGLTGRLANGAWALHAEVRGGALRVAGYGFTENAADWLVWWEGAVFGGRRFAWGVVGLELAASPLSHRAVTVDGSVSEAIPRLRLGIAGTFDLR